MGPASDTDPRIEERARRWRQLLALTQAARDLAGAAEAETERARLVAACAEVVHAAEAEPEWAAMPDPLTRRVLYRAWVSGGLDAAREAVVGAGASAAERVERAKAQAARTERLRAEAEAAVAALDEALGESA